MWPTPRATEGTSGDYQYDRGDHSKPRLTLKGAVKVFPAPQMPEVVGGTLNPDWVEWLMGWPIGWTACEPLETARFRLWLHSHGTCCPSDATEVPHAC